MRITTETLVSETLPTRESLLALPLVRHLIDDPAIPLVERSIDRRWSYEGVIQGSVAGFNPLRGEVYYGARSRLADWLGDPQASARTLNDRDLLVHELLFAVHDHLHAWARLAIDAIAPELGLGVRRLDRDDLDRWTFCLLLTEAAATVGLDYWFLSQVELGELITVGTAVRNLTTSYRHTHLHELRRFDESLDPGSPEFFTILTEFYCTGEWPGSSADDLRASPLLRRWLEHELSYGAKQRSYTRAWLLALLGEPAFGDRLAAPLRCDQPWQRRLIAELQPLLWRKVRNGEALVLPRRQDPDENWSAPHLVWPDFRFCNLNAMGGRFEGDLDGLSRPSLRHLLRQLLSRCAYEAVAPERRRLLAGLLSRDLHELSTDVLLDLVEHAGLPIDRAEPRDLFFLN